MSSGGIYIKKAHLQLGIASLTLWLGVSCYLLFLGEFVAVEAWLVVIAAFLPVFLASRLVKSGLLQLVIGMAVATQLISVPIFVLNRESYSPTGWSAVKDFAFTLPEFIQIYSLLAFFLFAVVCWVAFLVWVFKLPALSTFQVDATRNKMQPAKSDVGFYLILMICAVVVMVPLNMWMFRNGISLVGVEPPRLPYRLSGILHYFTYLVVPALLAMLYAKTSRSYLPAAILMGYALLLGLSQVSKSAVLLVLLPVLYCAIRDRKHLLLSISAIISLVSIQMVALFRGVVYIVEEGKSGSDVASGLFDSLGKLVDEGLQDFSIVDAFTMLVNRIEGAQDIVLSSKFNVDAVGGVFDAFLRFYYDRWTIINADDFHIELIGVALPEGYVAGGGGLLAKCLMITQSQPLLIVIFALNVAAFLVLGEWIARTIGAKYANSAYYSIAGGLYGLFFYTGSGTTVFLALLTLLLFIALMPKLKLGHE